MKKVFFFLKTRGLRETARRTVLHVQRKQAEKRYVRRMRPTEETLAAQRKESESWPVTFSVIVPLYNTPLDLLREMMDSVAAQSYEKWELCLADGSDGAHEEVGKYVRERAAADPRIRYRRLEKNEGISGNTNTALDMASGEYIALFDHDDLLMPDALYEMAKAIRAEHADFLYSDEMIFASPKITRIVGIRFKQDFSPEDLLTNNYICHLTVFRRSLLDRAGAFRSAYDGSQDHDLILRLTAAAEKVIHVPKVLYLWRAVAGSTASDIHTKEYAIDSGRRAVEDFLHARGRPDAQVRSAEVFPTMYRIREPIAGNPSVRVLLTGGKDAAADRARLERLKGQTAWKNCAWETVSIPEGSSRREALAKAAEKAKEDYLLFAEDLGEALAPDWVEEMLMHAQRREIGAVGARVRFAGSMDLRHAGIILGLGARGVAGRPYFDRYDDQVGFFGQLAVVREVSAVTDCWMIRRSTFEAAGGFDGAYRDSLYDIDLCMRLRRQGLRNLWTPYASLRGGKARDFRMEAGAEAASWPEDSEVFRARWSRELAQGDPCYNPNLSLLHEDWRLKDQKELVTN